MSNQVKSKQRVSDYGEVFTNEREVKAMCDLVLQETERSPAEKAEESLHYESATMKHKN